MKILLDTHAFLWAIMDPDQLSEMGRNLIEDPNNDILVSAVVSWEIAIKANLKRIKLPESPSKFIPRHIKKAQFDTMAIRHTHTLGVYDLPNYHQDPFDRLLIAQAQAEKLPILTKDPFFQKYEVKVIW